MEFHSSLLNSSPHFEKNDITIWKFIRILKYSHIYYNYQYNCYYFLLELFDSYHYKVLCFDSLLFPSPH